MAWKPKRKVQAVDPRAAASKLDDGEWIVRSSAGEIIGRATTPVNAWRGALRCISA